MINSQAIALGTTPCWSGCLYEINPEIAGIEPVNESKFDRTSDDKYFEEQDNDNS